MYPLLQSTFEEATAEVTSTWTKLELKVVEYSEAFILMLPSLILGLLIVLFSIFLAGRVSRFIKKRMERKAKDPLLETIIRQFTRLIFISLGVALALDVVGLGGIANSIVAGAGISALIFGFAFRDIGENFLAGIILAFSRPFAIGDTVENSGFKGKIVSLSMRETQIKTADGKDVFIPNSMIMKNALVNFTRDGFLRYEFTVGIDTNDNVERAQEVILKAVGDVSGVLGNRPPQVIVDELSTSSISLRVFYWVNTFDKAHDAGQVKTEVMAATKDVLISQGIVMPADIVELKIYQENRPIPLRMVEEKSDAVKQ